MPENGNNKRVIKVMEVGSAEEEKADLRASAAMLAKQGNSEGMKILQEIHAQERYDNLVTHIDDDEYEFAG